MNEDEAEMASLRARSSRYQQHIQTYGSRAEVRAIRESRDEARERLALQELREAEGRSSLGAAAADDSDDDFPPPIRAEDEEEEDSFGLAKRKPLPGKAVPNAPLPSRGGGSSPKKEPEGGEAADAEEAALRAMLPMSFGAQPKRAPVPSSLHLKRKRPLGGITMTISSAVKTEPGLPPPEVPAAPSSGAEEQGQRKKQKAVNGKAVAAGSGTSEDEKAGENASGENDKDGDDDDDDDDDSDDENPYDLPISHEVTLAGHSKAASALALDPAGARLVSGSYDYHWHMYAFSGMDSNMRHFRDKEPEEGHQIRHLRYDRRGNRFLCVTGAAQAKVFDREGIELAHFIRGDMYLHDMRFTKGHVSMVTDGQWSPTEEDVVITCGQDGTVRFWNVKQPKKNLHVSVYKNKQGLRQPITAMAVSPNGSMLALAGTDGGIQLFPISKGAPAQRPSARVNDAHAKDTETSCLCFSRDNTTLLSRGGDGTLKVWDTKNFKAPVLVAENLPNAFAETDVILSPNEQLVVTATSEDREHPELGGRLVFFDRRTLRPVESVRVSDRSAIRVVWNERINQIFVGCMDGKIHGFYDPGLSSNGALLCAVRKPRAAVPGEQFEHLDIITPHALRMYRPDPSERKQKLQARKDPKLSQMPLPPIEGGVGRDGRIQNTKLNQFFMKQVLAKETAALPEPEDPRDAILRYANIAREEPIFSSAYLKTQPKAIFREPSEEEAAEEDRASIASNRRYGGLEQLKQQLRERSEEIEREHQEKK